MSSCPMERTAAILAHDWNLLPGASSDRWQPADKSPTVQSKKSSETENAHRRQEVESSEDLERR